MINSPQSYITTVGIYNDNNDLLATAKLSKPLLKDFTKENDLPEVKGIVFEGEVLDGSEFKRFANVPSKEESLAKMIALLRSPLTKVAFALKSPMTSFGNVLNNLKENKSN